MRTGPVLGWALFAVIVAASIGCEPSTPLELYGVKVGEDASDAARILMARFREMPSVENTVTSMTFGGSPRVHAYGRSAPGGLVGYADLNTVQDPNGSRLSGGSSSVDQKYVLRQLTAQYGAVAARGDAWCTASMRWTRGGAKLEVCRNSETHVGELQITLEDETFKLNALNGAQVRGGGGARPNL